MLRLTDAVAALLLAADLVVVVVSVLLRSWFNAPVEWADDVARGLMVGSSFFGAASAIARLENPGVSFFVDLLPAASRRRYRHWPTGSGPSDTLPVRTRFSPVTVRPRSSHMRRICRLRPSRSTK
ncbi:MAG TPA: TRAP transporter small permease subunit, partial [Reyranella sp.]|nr:TRAP transporter small permease subunit [Reyranella sp.]